MESMQAFAFEEFPELRTPRLKLRALQDTDAAGIFSMRKNERINQYIGRAAMKEEADAMHLVQRSQALFTDRKGIAWAGEQLKTGRFLGTCGFNTWEPENRRAEIGGELDVQAWGKHVAFEAVQAILEFGFNRWNLHSVEAKVLPANRSAIYLLERLGFQKEAHFKARFCFQEKFYDLAVYTVFADTWNPNAWV